MSNNNFEKLIEKLRAKYPGKNNNLARGKAFEPICKWALENEPIYKNLYKKVWLWVIGLANGIEIKVSIS